MIETIQRPLPPDWLEQVTIRHLKKADLPALEWEGEYRRFRRNYADAYERMKRGLTSMWVADLAGFGVIGQVFLQYDCDRKELADGKTRTYFFAFRVRPQFRSAGVGARLLKTVEVDTWLKGARTICLNVARDNPRAQEFYARHGYKITAPDPGIWFYYDDLGELQEVNEPAWRMEKSLTGI